METPMSPPDLGAGPTIDESSKNAADNGPGLHSEERFQNAYSLLQKTLEFLVNEYGVHFALFSCYKSLQRNSVVAFTSPGLAAAYFTESSGSGLDALTDWHQFCRDGEYGEKFTDAEAFSKTLHSDVEDEEENEEDDKIELPGPLIGSLKRPSSQSQNQEQPLMKKPAKKSLFDTIERLSHSSEPETSQNESSGCSSSPEKEPTMSHAPVKMETGPLDLSAAIKAEAEDAAAAPISLFMSSITPPNPTLNPKPEGMISPATSDQTDERPRNSALRNNMARESLTPEQIIAKGSWMCPQCCKIIKYKRNARAHLMSHSAIRPCFSCSLCDQSFTTKWNLKKHLKLNHGIDMDITDPLMNSFDTHKDKKSPAKFFPPPSMAGGGLPPHFYSPHADMKSEKDMDMKPAMFGGFPKDLLGAHVDHAKALQVLNSAANAGMLLHQGFLAGRMLGGGGDHSPGFNPSPFMSHHQPAIDLSRCHSLEKPPGKSLENSVGRSMEKPAESTHSPLNFADSQDQKKSLP